MILVKENENIDMRSLQMKNENLGLLKEKCGEDNYKKLTQLNNPEILNFISKYVELCNPNSVFVRTDSKEDTLYIRNKSEELGEEIPLNIEGHTIHFDGINDQARDKGNTKFLLTKKIKLGNNLNSINRIEGLLEVQELLKNIMTGKEMYVLFLALGPVNSVFSIYAIQITDSAYVAHSEDILYRPAYKVFKEEGQEIRFFRFIHSSGELENKVSKNIDERRIYVDLLQNTVFSINTQYAGNTVGLKKLALRLAIRKADLEGWLAEHMFIMRVNGPKNRKSYFTGAFPSACGKTATCMEKGENIVGDDIAYLRKIQGKVFAANVERGIFGIIKDVNEKDIPFIWETLNMPGEVIFSNVLLNDKDPFWLGDGRDIPDSGINFSGKWFKDKTDEVGNLITHAHKNARYTIPLIKLKNYDRTLVDREGVEVSGIIYGGRDSDTWPPVFQSFNWKHGVITIASSLESETTSATLGKEGIRKFNLMANLDFLSVSVGKYIENHLNFVNGLDKIPIIFGVNYYLKDADGAYLNGMHDKRIWLKWMELRLNDEVKAINTPIGFIPKYEDLKKLFKKVLQKDYTEAEYLEQFTLRVPENIEKIKRITNIFKEISEAPEVLFNILEDQMKRLEEYAHCLLSF